MPASVNGLKAGFTEMSTSSPKTSPNHAATNKLAENPQPSCKEKQKDGKTNRQKTEKDTEKKNKDKKETEITLNTSVSPTEQRDIIGDLQAQEESLHVYCVSKAWYETWKKYVGLVEVEEDKTNIPGPIYMDCEDDDNNMLVDEKVWTKWVEWYGVSMNHELDRRNWASDEKEFEICKLSPYCTLLDNPLKDFDISEETGYVELQMRRIFHVPESRKSRLWAREKSRIKFGRFQLLLDRCEELCYQDLINHDHDYVIAIEVAQSDGTWPTGYPGEPAGNLAKYDHLTRLQTHHKFWQKELQTTIESVFTGISGELRETTNGVVHTAFLMTENHERSLEERDTKVKSDEDQLIGKQDELKQRAELVTQEENRIESERKTIEDEKEKLSKDRKRLDDEIQHMTTVHEMAESKVHLNVGGTVYMTSKSTLTKDPDSMLAAMFSGRHEVKTEKDGSVFLDRDGTHFRYILNFLRDGGFRSGTLPEDQAFLTELVTEAEYYQISGLVAYLSATLASIDDQGLGFGHSDERSSKRISRKMATKKQ